MQESCSISLILSFTRSLILPGCELSLAICILSPFHARCAALDPCACQLFVLSVHIFYGTSAELGPADAACDTLGTAISMWANYFTGLHPRERFSEDSRIFPIRASRNSQPADTIIVHVHIHIYAGEPIKNRTRESAKSSVKEGTPRSSA